jgi:hypothetical protein
MSQTVHIASAANTALVGNVVWGLNSTNFPDLTNIIGLFDEMRIIKGRIHFMFNTDTVGAGFNQVTPAALGVTFDPISTAPTSVTSVMNQSYHTQPYLLNSTSTLLSPQPYRLETLSFTMPSPLAPITSSDIPGSAWFALDGGTAPTLLLIQYWCDRMGAGGTSALTYIVELDIELKIRT